MNASPVLRFEECSMKRLFSVCLAFAIGAILAPETAAQDPVAVTPEASVGFSVGSGGTYVHRAGPSLDLMLGMRMQETPAGTLVGGFTIGVPLPVARPLICILLPSGECAPEFPQFFSGGALLGVQRGSAQGPSARILAGPTYYYGHRRSGALGLQGRLDMATPPFLHTSVVASLRGAVLPSFEEETLGITSFGLGLRIQ
jgi:hypothetical protein